jgi:hypothetical protein
MRNKGKRAPTWRVTTVAVLKIRFTLSGESLLG